MSTVSLCELFLSNAACICGLTGTLGHTDGAKLVFCIRVRLQFECVLVVDQSLGTLRQARA